MLPAVGRQRAGRDRHQRGLARAVLAEQGVDLPGLRLERDALERVDPVEALPHVGEPQHLDALGCHCHCAYSWYLAGGALGRERAERVGPRPARAPLARV